MYISKNNSFFSSIIFFRCLFLFPLCIVSFAEPITKPCPVEVGASSIEHGSGLCTGNQAIKLSFLNTPLTMTWHSLRSTGEGPSYLYGFQFDIDRILVENGNQAYLLLGGYTKIPLIRSGSAWLAADPRVTRSRFVLYTPARVRHYREIRYDGSNRLYKIMPNWPRERRNTDTIYALIEMTDRRGRTNTIERDYYGRITGYSLFNGKRSTVVRAAENGNPSDVISFSGAHHYLNYLGNTLRSATFPDNTTVQFGYDGYKINSVTEGDRRTHYTFMADGTVTSILDPDGVETTFEYSSDRVTVRNDFFRKTEYFYTSPAELLGSLHRVDLNGMVTTLERSPVDKKKILRHIDPLGLVTLRTYIDLSLEAGRIIPLVASRTNPYGIVANYEYDPEGFITKEVKTRNSNRIETNIELNAKKEAISVTVNGHRTELVSDSLDRITGLRDSNLGTLEAYEYSKAGLVQTSSFLGVPKQTYRYTPDALLESISSESGVRLAITRETNGLPRRVELTNKAAGQFASLDVGYVGDAVNYFGLNDQTGTERSFESMTRESNGFSLQEERWLGPTSAPQRQIIKSHFNSEGFLLEQNYQR